MAHNLYVSVTAGLSISHVRRPGLANLGFGLARFIAPRVRGLIVFEIWFYKPYILHKIQIKWTVLVIFLDTLAAAILF